MMKKTDAKRICTHARCIEFMLMLLVLFGMNGVVVADELVIPKPADVQQAIERYVDEAKQAPGVVVGIVHESQRQVFNYGDSGRDAHVLDGESQFEIGSIGKVFTGLLLAEMVQRGEVRYSDTVAELAPDGYSFAEPIADITLEQLATHTSGLPRLAMNFGPVMRGLFTDDPYAGSTPDEIFRAVAGTTPDLMTTQGEFAYSNLGYGLLGQLLAQAGGQSYQALLYERVLEPLNLASIPFGHTAADPNRLVQGFNKGRAASHWSLDAYAPAGGLVASVNQMLDFIQANLDPELLLVLEAQQTRGESSGEFPRTLGLGYAHRQIGGQEWLWHNGGTGGFRSYFGFAPEMDFGIVILTNGTGNSDALAASLIRTDAEPPEPHQTRWFGLLMSAMGIVFAPFTLLVALFAKPKPPKEGKRAPDRLDLIVLITGAAMMLVVSRLAGDWITVPYSLWWLGLVVSVAAAGALLRAQFLQRKGISGGAWGVFARVLIVLLYSLIIVAFI